MRSPLSAVVVLLSPDQTAYRQRSGSAHHVGTTTRANESDAGPAEAMVALIRTTIVSVLGPVVAQLDAARQMVDHAQGQIVWVRPNRPRQFADAPSV